MHCISYLYLLLCFVFVFVIVFVTVLIIVFLIVFVIVFVMVIVIVIIFIIVCVIVFLIAFAIVFCNCICIWGNPTNEKQGELCLVFCICTLSFTPATMIVLMWVTNIRRVLNDRHYDPLIIHCGEV